MNNEKQENESSKNSVVTDSNKIPRVATMCLWFGVFALLATSIYLFTYWIDMMNQSFKPAIYLYPTKDEQVDVSIKFKRARMTKNIPPYKKGWSVFATKEGILDGKYDYLFFESEWYGKPELSKEGWVVAYGDLKNWFDVHLIKLGLNEKEKNQFEEYWLQKLPKANYYEIKLVTLSCLEERTKLNINPKPDTVIRLMFYFTPLNEKTTLPEFVIHTPERKGFVAVEWGGFLGENLTEF